MFEIVFIYVFNNTKYPTGANMFITYKINIHLIQTQYSYKHIIFLNSLSFFYQSDNIIKK